MATLGLPDSSAGKESACNVGDLGWIPGLGRSHGEGKGYALQYSGQENSMDCRSPGKGIGYSLQYSVQVNFMDCIVHGVAKSERRDRLSTPAFVDFPCGSAGKGSACNVVDLGSIPGLGRYTGEGKGYPLQYSGLENSMDYIVHGVSNSQTRLRDFHFNFSLSSFVKFDFVPVHQPQASSIVHWTWTGDSFHIWYYTYFSAILPNHPTLSILIYGKTNTIL